MFGPDFNSEINQINHDLNKTAQSAPLKNCAKQSVWTQMTQKVQYTFDTGVRQGSVTSPQLVNIFINAATAELFAQKEISTFQFSTALIEWSHSELDGLQKI